MAELGHHGDRDRVTFFWDTEPEFVSLRQTPDPMTLGLALAPATGFFDYDGPTPNRCGPTTERIPN